MPDKKRIKYMSNLVKSYIRPNSKILELGGGENKVKIPNSKVVELDIEKFDGVNVKWNLEKTPLPFRKNEFDAIFSYAVLEHIHNILPLFEDFHRILKPKGKLICFVPHFAGLSAIHFIHCNYFCADSFGLFLPENTDFNFETKARFKIIERRITFRPILKPFEILFNLNDSIRRFYEGSIFKNLIPPIMILAVMEAVK